MQNLKPPATTSMVHLPMCVFHLFHMLTFENQFRRLKNLYCELTDFVTHEGFEGGHWLKVEVQIRGYNIVRFTWSYTCLLSRTPWHFEEITFRSEEVGCDHVID